MKPLAALGAIFFAGSVLATPLHNIVVFGDSLSDNGNLYEVMKNQLPPSPPYYEGRFSNGPVWIEHLTASYFPENPKAHLFDYAYGGAGVTEDESDDDVLFTLRREVNTYLLSHDDKASADSLFVVWIGANNYLALPEDPDKSIQEVKTGITKSLQRLAEKGAKHIMVVNVPDLGRTPAAIEFDAIDVMTYLTKEHNKELINTLSSMKEQYPDVQWIFFDMNDAFSTVLDYPKDYGFTNITGTCVNNSLSASLTSKSVLKLVSQAKPGLKSDVCEGYLFFDLVHPTAHAHEILATRARKILDELGVEITD